MKRILYSVALVTALALVSVPAIADHITEPTAPITGTSMEIYAYPNFPTRLVQCDGSETPLTIDGVPADSVRIETFVTSNALRFGNPSEHYTEIVALFLVRDLGTPQETERYEWDTKWKHSNIPPHASAARGNGWESSQNNQSFRVYPAGTVLRFKTQVVGDESGNVFTDSCTFTVG